MTSAESLISCRSSPTIESSPVSGTRSFPRSSSSAVVAWRPEKIPKLTRISRPDGSCSATNAIAFSTCIETRIPWLGPGLTLHGFPAKTTDRHEGSAHAPGGEDGDRARARPDLVAVQVHGVDELDEVLQRQDGADRAQRGRIVRGGPEAAGEERHREQDRVDDRRRALRGADQRRDPEPHRREGSGAEQ